MKRIIISIGVVLLLSLSLYSGEKGSVRVTVGPLISADSNFTDIYGDVGFYPEIKAGYKIFRNIFFWIGYGYLSKKGTTPVLKLETVSVQHYFSFGAGFTSRIAEKLYYKAELGLFLVNYKEKAMGDTRSESDDGLHFNIGVIYNFSHRIFTEVSLGYLTAVDEVDEKSIKLGGFRTIIGLGVYF